MIIEKWKKKALMLSIILMVSGAITSFIGFGMSGWDANKYETHDSENWYRTFQMN